jgi:hypothetical protein
MSRNICTVVLPALAPKTSFPSAVSHRIVARRIKSEAAVLEGAA